MSSARVASARSGWLEQLRRSQLRSSTRLECECASCRYGSRTCCEPDDITGLRLAIADKLASAFRFLPRLAAFLSHRNARAGFRLAGLLSARLRFSGLIAVVESADA